MAALSTMCSRTCLLSRQTQLIRIECLPKHNIPNLHGSRIQLYSSGSRLSSILCRSYTKHSCQRTRLFGCFAGSRNVIPSLTAASVNSIGYNRRFHSKDSSAGGSVTDELLKSKLQAESSQASDNSQNEQSGDKEKEEKKESRFTGKNAWKMGIIMLSGMGLFSTGFLLVSWGAPSLDEDGKEIIDEYTPLPKWRAYPKRAFREFHFFKKMIQEPSSDKLLPDPLKEPYYQPPYTLVLEMTGVLVHPDWTLNTGWRFKKRPAITYFLQQVGPPLFEVVIYTKEQGMTAFPIIDGLDPQGMISFRLFRDATRYIDGAHCKDLDCLNRDLSKVIVVDCDPKAVGLHPKNAIRLDKWAGSDDDRVLVDLAVFLRTLAMSGVEDVRPILDYYSNFDDPLGAFKENQRKLQEEQEKNFLQKREQDEAKQPLKNWGFSLSGRRR